MIGGTLCVEARVSLLPADSGGLDASLPTGTRSLLLHFPALNDRDDEPVEIGAVIEALDGGVLEPGPGKTTVRLRFWADEAAIYATPGTTFRLWHGRIVGEGVVVRIVDDVGDASS